MRVRLGLVSALAAIGLGVPAAFAQISDGVVRIGVLNDQSGLYADLGGPGSVVAARMAVEDIGSAVLGQLFDRFGWSVCVAGVGAALLMAALLTARLTLTPPPGASPA